MTVKELIDRLSEFQPNLDILVRDEHGEFEEITNVKLDKYDTWNEVQNVLIDSQV